MSNDKQSSVEWQYNELMMINFQLKTNRITSEYFEEQLGKIKEQSKAMHKDEIMDARTNGKWSCTEKYGEIRINIQYYNETFGGNK